MLATLYDSVSISVQQNVRCEIYSVIRFFIVKDKTPTEIYRELEFVYEEGVITEDKKKEFVNLSKKG